MYRRLFFVSAFLLFTMSAFAQDIILKRDNAMILSIVEEISDTEIVYKSFDNPNGPRYRISKSDVVQIQYQNGKVDRFDSSGPINNKPQEATSTTPDPIAPNTTVIPTNDAAPYIGKLDVIRGELVSKGRKLTSEEALYILGNEEYDRFRSASRKRTTGKVLLITGGSLWVGSIAPIVYGGIYMYISEGDETFFTPGLVMCIIGGVMHLTGLAMVTAGIPTAVVGSSRIRSVANDYNERHQYASTLSIGPTSSGFGLSYKF